MAKPVDVGAEGNACTHGMLEMLVAAQTALRLRVGLSAPPPLAFFTEVVGWFVGCSAVGFGVSLAEILSAIGESASRGYSDAVASEAKRKGAS